MRTRIQGLVSKSDLRAVLWTVALSVVLCVAGANADNFYIAGSPDTDSVIFASQAKLEFIEGKTNSIRGVINFDPSSPQVAGGKIRVDAKTLKTGIELRDEHMRERHLHTDQFPYIEFEPRSTNLIPAQLVLGSTAKFEITGDFTVHGVTHTITAPATVEMLPVINDSTGKAMLVTAKFEIKLDDYDVPRPKMLLLKLAETIDIYVRFVASTSNPSVDF